MAGCSVASLLFTTRDSIRPAVTTRNVSRHWQRPPAGAKITPGWQALVPRGSPSDVRGELLGALESLPLQWLRHEEGFGRHSGAGKSFQRMVLCHYCLSSSYLYNCLESFIQLNHCNSILFPLPLPSCLDVRPWLLFCHWTELRCETVAALSEHQNSLLYVWCLSQDLGFH